MALGLEKVDEDQRLVDLRNNQAALLEKPPQVQFHMAEAAKLNSEIASLVAATSENIKYSLLSSGAVFAWSAAISIEHEAAWENAVASQPASIAVLCFVPFVISLVFAMFSKAAYERIVQKGHYLRRLEAAFALDKLGWEAAFSSSAPKLRWAHTIAWWLLVGGNLVIGLLLFSSWRG